MTGGQVVHIVDDEEGVRSTLAQLAESAGHTAQAHANAESLLARLDMDRAGCVVSDVRMPRLSGLDLLRALHARDASVPVILITGQGDVPMAVEALKAGAADFIEKPFEAQAFLASLERALARRAAALEGRAALEAIRQRMLRLSEREHEVMDLVVAGLANAAIADRLGISVRTVENHRARVMEKMEARGLPELMRMALRLDASAPLNP